MKLLTQILGKTSLSRSLIVSLLTPRKHSSASSKNGWDFAGNRKTKGGSKIRNIMHGSWSKIQPKLSHIKGKSGFTLTEVVVSSVVFIAFCIPIIGLLSTTKYTQKRTAKRLEAMLIGQGVLDEIRHNTEVYGSAQSRWLSTIPREYAVNKTFTSFPESEDLLLLTVKVRWSEFNKKQETEMSTLISLKSNFYAFK